MNYWSRFRTKRTVKMIRYGIAQLNTIAADWCQWLFWMMLWTGLLFVAVRIVDALSTNRIRASIRLMLYGIVLARLLLPLTWHSSVGLASDTLYFTEIDRLGNNITPVEERSVKASSRPTASTQVSSPSVEQRIFFVFFVAVDKENRF